MIHQEEQKAVPSKSMAYQEKQKAVLCKASPLLINVGVLLLAP